jgi:hypothetical protein
VWPRWPPCDNTPRPRETCARTDLDAGEIFVDPAAASSRPRSRYLKTGAQRDRLSGSRPVWLKLSSSNARNQIVEPISELIPTIEDFCPDFDRGAADPVRTPATETM